MSYLTGFINEVMTTDSHTELPEGTMVADVTAHGACLWARTAWLDARHSGKRVRNFLRVIHPNLDGCHP